jgi:hypothetical protein
MKKFTIILVTLTLLASGMAMAEDLEMSVGATATVKWGFKGQLIDNTGSFLEDAKPSGDFYSDGGDLNWEKYPKLTLTASVEDADGNVVVKAATKAKSVDLTTYPTPGAWDDEDKAYDLTLDYITFPNVVPGLLGLSFKGPDDLDPAYLGEKDGDSSNERIFVTVTPIDQLEAEVGLLIKPDNALTTSLYSAALGAASGTVATTGTVVYPTDPETTGTITLDDSTWQTGTYLSWALSLEATFTQAIGEDGEISVGLGTVIDSAYTNGTYLPDFEIADYVGYDKFYSPFVEATMNDDQDSAVIAQMYGPIAVNALTLKQTMPSLFASTDDAKMLRTNEVRGRSTIPVGVGVTAAFGDLSAAADFQMVLAEGKDTSYATGVYDVTNPDESTVDYATYAMPMYAAVDVGYEMAMGDMTITPGLNFKYVSDFWKWAWDGDVWAYDGEVSGADWVGRPMSLDAGVDVEGIAGMIDVSISASVGLGDGVGNHGYGILALSDPENVASVIGFLPSYTVTQNADGEQTFVFDNTLAEMIDFFKLGPTAAGSDTNTWNTELMKEDADSATDGMNNQWFGAASASAMGIEVGITVAPIDGLTIINTTNYDVDNLGIGMDADTGTLFGIPLSTLANKTDVSYKWMVGDVTAFTLYGIFTYTSKSYFTEDGQKYVGLRADTETVAPDVYEFSNSEVPSKATFDYEVGMKMTVGL